MFQLKNRLLNATRNGHIILFKSHHYLSANFLPTTQFSKKKCFDNNTVCCDVKVPLAQSVRSMGSLDIKRARIPHKERALVLELTHEKFKFPLKGLPVSETCINAVKHKYLKKKEVSPYERILARELLEIVEAGQMLIIVHMHPCTSEKLFEQEVQLHRNNMKWLYYPNTISKLAFTGTKYESLVPLYSKDTHSIVSYDKDFKKFLSLERHLPSMLTLGVVVEDRVLSVSELKAAAELPPLPLMRGTLLNTLRAQQQQLTRQLAAHQVELTQSLERYSARPAQETNTS